VETLEERMAPALLTVNTLRDDNPAGILSLRQAIAVVNTGNLGLLDAAQRLLVDLTEPLGVNDRIQFAGSAQGTVSLGAGGQLTLSRAVTIAGPGPGNLSINAHGASRAFSVSPGVGATISAVTVQGGSANGGGGILNLGSLTLSGSTVSGNAATGQGSGGGVNNSFGATLRVSNSTLLANSAGNAGGGIFNLGTLMVDGGSLLSGNTAGDGGGGGIASYSSLTVSDATFTGNGAQGGDGGGIYLGSGGEAAISNGTFSQNSADHYGGGISADDMLTVTGSRFNENTAYLGGGMFAGAGLGATDTSFSGNTARFGAGLAHAGDTATLTNGNFTGNTAAVSGGAVHNAGALTLTDSTLTGNSAQTSGGAVDNLGTLSVGSSTLSGNTSYGTGGGIDNPGALTFGTSTLSGNLAYGTGGGINNTGGLTVSDSTLSGNTSYGAGGGINNTGALTIDESTLSGNAAAGGGGLAHGGSATATLTSTTVTANRDNTGAGGGLSITTPESVTLHNSIVAGNSWGATASDIGGAVYDNSTFNLIGTGGSGGLVSGDVFHNQVGVSDPGLGPLADNGGPTQTHALLAGSPALNTGDQYLIPNPDQRGNVRGRYVSIGAYDPNVTRLVFSSVPPTLAAGGDLAFTVTALDAFGKVAVGFRGNLGATSSDPAAPYQGSHNYDAADGGSFTFTGSTLLTPGPQTLMVRDFSFDQTLTATAVVTVTAGQAVGLEFTAPNAVRAGDLFSVTVTARDSAGNVVPDYAGTVSVTSNDPQVPVLASHTFVAADHGTFTFTGLMLRTAQFSTLTASDGALSQPTVVLVNPGDFAQLLLHLSQTTMTAGSNLVVTVTAADQFGNTVPGYRGTVTATSTDPHFPLLFTHTFAAADQGRYAQDTSLITAGAQTVTASDGTASATADVTVNPDAAAGFLLSGPATVTAGVPFAYTVTVVDQWYNVVPDYTGTMSLTSSDPLVPYLGSHTFVAADGGSFTFSGLVLRSAGNVILSANADASGLAGYADVQVLTGPGTGPGGGGAAGASTGYPVSLTAKALDVLGKVGTGYGDALF
jgi:predicted outer membrane repeat protein